MGVDWGLVIDGGTKTGTGAELEGAGASSVCGWVPGSWLRQVPASPGRQQEHGVPFRTQAHLKHLAVPLQRQHLV